MEINSVQRVFDIFKGLNGVPRPSHEEGKVADWLCGFAEKNGLEYDRDLNNCVVIRKPASEGYEDQSRFESMQKVGMTKAEIRKSINSQLLTVFRHRYSKCNGCGTS